MNNFVINVKENTKRQEHIKQQFQGIDFSFFNAITPKNLAEVLDNNLADLKNSVLSPVEQSCFMSHFLLMKKCITENLAYIAIFEDDIFLNQEAKLFLNNDKWLFENFDLQEKTIIKLETNLAELALKNTGIIINNYNFQKIKSKDNCMAAYIISKPACEYFLEKLKILSKDILIKPIDDILFDDLIKDKNLNFYQINPAICIQDILLNKEKYNLTSQLDEEREFYNKKRKEVYYKTRGISGRLKKMGKNLINALIKVCRFLKLIKAETYSVVPFKQEN